IRTFTNVSTDQVGDFTGTPTYSIFGSITNNSGAGIRGATVTLSGSSAASITTDCDGFYFFDDLVQGGNYTITPSLGSATFTPPNRSYTNLQASQASQNFTTQSVPFFTVSGFVRLANGNSVSGVNIATGSQAQCFFQQPPQTNSDGFYSVILQGGASYTFTAIKPGLTFTPQSPTINLGSNQTLNFTATAATGLVGKIAFSNLTETNSEIFTINADGSNQINVTNNPAGDYGPAWSPDGL